MSFFSVIKRCDHEGCTNTYEQMDPKQSKGWAITLIRLAPQATIQLDYCPDHQEQHAP